MRISDWSSDVCSSDLTEGRQSMQVTGPGASNGARCTSPFPVTSLDPPTAGLSLLFLSCALGLGCREQGSQGLVAFEQERHAFGVGGEFWGFAAGGLFGGEVGGVHGLVELLVGLDQGGRHGQGVVEGGEEVGRGAWRGRGGQ